MAKGMATLRGRATNIQKRRGLIYFTIQSFDVHTSRRMTSFIEAMLKDDGTLYTVEVDSDYTVHVIAEIGPSDD